MGLMSLINYSREDKNVLLDVAKQSIKFGLKNRQALPVSLEKYSAALQTNGASFVTLNLNNQLCGCIGTLDAYQALVKDVSEHAFAAAFNDPRFAPVTQNEAGQLDIHISILTPPEPIQFKSEADLLAQLRPNIDGLILQAGHHKATFLPSVWEQLDSPENFINHLKTKAGLGIKEWPDNIIISRYKSIYI